MARSDCSSDCRFARSGITRQEIGDYLALGIIEGSRMAPDPRDSDRVLDIVTYRTANYFSSRRPNGGFGSMLMYQNIFSLVSIARVGLGTRPARRCARPPTLAQCAACRTEDSTDITVDHTTTTTTTRINPGQCDVDSHRRGSRPPRRIGPPALRHRRGRTGALGEMPRFLAVLGKLRDG